MRYRLEYIRLYASKYIESLYSIIIYKRAIAKISKK